MKVYIVMGTEGEYDSFYEWPEAVFLDKDRATQYAKDKSWDVAAGKPLHTKKDYYVSDAFEVIEQ
jgi:hypothetical protein